MNYPAFMKKVDEYAEQGDADELRMFIHNLARDVRQPERDAFLLLLSDSCNIVEEAKGRPHASDSVTLEERVDEALAGLQEIIDGEVELDSEYNEEWDDWNDSEDEEFFFSDPEGLLADIDSAFSLLHDCLDHEIYKKGAALAEKLSEVRVQVSGEYSDYGENDLSIYDLVCQNLLKSDYKTGIKEAVYLSCVGNEENQRASAMLQVLNRFQLTSITLEDILQTGTEEIELESFLPSWIAELAKQFSAYAEGLLLEAQMMLMNDGKELQVASQYATTHPALYVNYLKEKKTDHSSEELKTVGMKALDEVPLTKAERADIALLTAAYALKSADKKCADACWKEAFRTIPSVTNYLRLRLLSDQWENNSETMREVYQAYYKKLPEWERRDEAGLYFFDGRFGELLSIYMKPGKGIGWSSTFMKEGISLMLLLLKQDQAGIGPGLKVRIKNAIKGCQFSSEVFCEGTDSDPGQDTESLFLEVFAHWRDTVVIPEEKQKKWLEMINGWISLRVEAIMNANRRNYYGECASFVAALGEVLESRGKMGAKNALMEEYRMKYSRRRAFHDDLRSYGMMR